MKRSNKPEILDGEMTERQLEESLVFMAKINRSFGGTRAVLDYFASKPLPDAFRVLDIGTGGGDIPNALSLWAQARGKRAEIVGLDLNPACVSYAETHFGRPGVKFVKASALDLERFGEFDFIISSMFFHHLDDGAIVKLLGLVDRCAKKGFLVNDLYRSWDAWAGAAALSALTFSGVVMNDATLSVRRGFVEDDFRRYASLAGVGGAEIKRKAWYRLTLSRRA